MDSARVDTFEPGVGFGGLLRYYRGRAKLSQNQLARGAGIDPAYVNRLEDPPSGQPRIPSRRVVEALASALGLDELQQDQLLVAAGYAPRSVLEVGAWDAALALVAQVLSDPSLSEQDRDEYRQVLTLVSLRWRRGE